MATTTNPSTTQKVAYRRPYKTRAQRREKARRKHDENSDHKFLVRVALVAGLLILLTLGFAMKGMTEHQGATPLSSEPMH